MALRYDAMVKSLTDSLCATKKEKMENDPTLEPPTHAEKKELMCAIYNWWRDSKAGVAVPWPPPEVQRRWCRAPRRGAGGNGSLVAQAGQAPAL